MAIVLAGLREPTPPPVGPQWSGVTSMTWRPHGTGREIDLIDPTRDGIMLLRDGVRGLNMPPVSRHTSTSPAVAGSRHRGHSVGERPVFWPTLVWTTEGSDAWAEVDDMLWSGLRPGDTGDWTIVTDRTGTRTLTCRYTGDSDHSYGRDPLKHGWAVYGIELVAEQPFWAGETETVTWGAAASSRAFLPGPPFWIGSSSTVDDAALWNGGDLPAHLVWSVDGPCSEARVGFTVDGVESVVDVPFTIDDGDTLVIDTRPHAQTATLHTAAGDVVDRTPDLTGRARFRAIPVGDAASLALAITGSGQITAELTPLYWRALT